MDKLVTTIFDILAVAFDKVTFLKGWRTVAGLVGLVIVGILQHQHIGSETLLSNIQIGLLGWSALSLNAKGREDK